ncbi:MAG: hypothetical protein HC786_14875 [Richelia sp. CSU_2_1]|nr:hypothetical protein [Richelia sp. CSU_2_1]
MLPGILADLRHPFANKFYGSFTLGRGDRSNARTARQTASTTYPAARSDYLIYFSKRAIGL